MSSEHRLRQANMEQWKRPVEKERSKRCATCGKVSLHGYDVGESHLFCWRRMAVMHKNRTCRKWEPILLDGIIVKDVWCATSMQSDLDY